MKTSVGLLLIDGNSLINRAFYALYGRHNLSAPDGTPTGALHTFMAMLLKLIEETNPSHVAVAFDLPGPTFRHQSYDAYKGTRKPMPDDLAIQLPLLRQILASSGLACVDLPGYEADDLIGTLAERAAPRMPVVIASGDRDCFQLIRPDVRVFLPTTREGRATTERYDSDAVRERYGIGPQQIVDLKALMGDSSDNIPGVRGIGEKGAIKLIAEYGSLEGVYNTLNALPAGLRQKLEQGREMAFLSRDLATIHRQVPLPGSLDDYRRAEPDQDVLVPLLTRLGLKSVILRLAKMGGLQRIDPQALVTDPAQDLPESESPDQSSGDSEDSPEHSAAVYLAIDGIAVAVPGEPILTVFDGAAASVPDEPPLSADNQAAESIPGEPALTAGIGDDPSEVRRLFTERRDLYWYVQDYKQFLHRTGASGRSGDLHDVMIAAYLLNQLEGRPDFDRLHQLVTGDPLVQPGEPLNLAIAAKATAALRQIGALQSREIRDRRLEFLFFEVEIPLAAILAGMERRGFLLDLDVLERLATEMSCQLDDLQSKIYVLSGRPFNLSSPRQLGDVLFEDLGLPTGKKRGSGQYSTDGEELNRLLDVHPIIPLIIEHRQVAKLKATYVDGLRRVVDKEDGRVHTTFQQTLTSTGRLSSIDPNLQNIPVRTEAGQQIRKAFIASPGHVLLDADYSQIELRLLAHLSGDPKLTEAFLNQEDIHRLTAERIFGQSADRITPAMRAIAKTMNFSIVYGISDFGLARDLGVSVREAHRYIAEYEQEYARVRPYLNSLVEAARQKGYVETIYGRRRQVPELKAQNRNVRAFGERAAMNMPIQGSAADLLKIAMVRCARGLEEAGLKARLILTVHDELIVEAPEDEADAAGTILRREMEQAAELRVPLVAEVRTGYSWADCK